MSQGTKRRMIGILLPKGRSRGEHVLAKSPGDSVRTCSVPENVDSPCELSASLSLLFRVPPRRAQDDEPKMKPMILPTAVNRVSTLIPNRGLR